MTPESISQLFFECHYSKYTWGLCKLKLGLNPMVTNLSEEAAQINAKFKPKDGTTVLAKLALSGAIWHV